MNKKLRVSRCSNLALNVENPEGERKKNRIENRVCS